jgi:hypothetical protein
LQASHKEWQLKTPNERTCRQQSFDVPSFPLSFWDQHFAVAIVVDLLWDWVLSLSSFLCLGLKSLNLSPLQKIEMASADL